jgi:hypothetical protein
VLFLKDKIILNILFVGAYTCNNVTKKEKINESKGAKIS